MDSNAIKINGYQIKDTLGHGGMATVYLAIQESFERKVAIKVMAEQLSSDPNFRDRFLQEAKIVSRLIHPNIVTVYDVGVTNNHHYLSMEYIEGVDLKEKLHSISLFHLIRVIKEVALALDYAGRKGYVHRDIKPENIMVNNEDGRAVLMDFGIAKAFDSISEMTQTGTAIGTPYYMSPEQAKGKEVDWRSDIYSLGIVFFQVLTSQLPYQGDSAVSVGIMHLTDPIPKLPDYMQAIFQPIIDKLMAKSPDERYQNGEDIIKALNAISDEQLAEINTEFTKEGHRDSGANINYNVSTPISSSGLTKVQRNSIDKDNQDDATKIINLAPNSSSQNKKSRAPFFITIMVMTLIVITTGDYFYNGDNSIMANLLPMSAAEKNAIEAANKEKAEKLKALKQQLANKKKLKIEKVKEQQEMASKLAILVNKANDLEPQLSTNNNVVDELYQTYQLISLLESKHPKAKQGFEKVKTVYLKIIEEQILNQQLELATKTLQKKLRAFPELANAEHIVSIQTRITTLNQITDLLAVAENHLSNNRLSGINDNNAHAVYQNILAIAPNNVKAQQGIMILNKKYHEIASKHIDNKQFQNALKYIKLGEDIYPASRTEFTILREKIDLQREKNAQLKVQEEKIQQLLARALLQEKSDNLIPPAKNNALSQYQTVLNYDSKNVIALKAITNIEQQLLSAIPTQISAQQYTKAQTSIDTALNHFPDSKLAKSQQTKLNNAIKQYKASQTPKIVSLIIKGQKFNKMTAQGNNKLKAERTIYLGFEFTNFAKKTTVLQAILYAGSRSDKLSTTPVIVSQKSGVKYFKISRPVSGFAEGGYYLDFVLKGEKISTNKFSIEN